MARSSSSGNNVDKGIKRNRNYPLDRSPGVQQLSHKFVDLTLEPDDNDDGIPYPKRPRQNGSNEPSGRKILPYDLLGNSIEDAIEITDDDDDTLLKDIMVECSLEDGVLDGTLDNDLAGDLLDDTDGRRASKRKASLSITASRSSLFLYIPRVIPADMFLYCKGHLRRRYIEICRVFELS